MSEADSSLEILIKTKADLAGAKAAEAQLEQDIAKAKALGEAYDDLETRLKNVRGAISESQGSDALVPSRSPGESSPETLIRRREDAMARQVPSSSSPDPESFRGREGEANEEKGGNGPMGWVKAGVEALRLAFEALPKTFGAAKNPIPASAETQDKVPVEDRAQQIAEKENNTGAAGPGLANGPEGHGIQATEQATRTNGQEENEIAGQVAESHSQAIQFSGERIRAALEQNTQITVSLFNRTLDLMDEQNRKLGEVDRKITELSGQIRSLKNL